MWHDISIVVGCCIKPAAKKFQLNATKLHAASRSLLGGAEKNDKIGNIEGFEVKQYLMNGVRVKC